MLRTALSKRVERRTPFGKCRSPDGAALRRNPGGCSGKPGLRRRAAPSGLLAQGIKTISHPRSFSI